MPKAFVLKDSPEEVLAAANEEPQGRHYSTPHSDQPSGIKIDELVLGMKLASIAITDDNPDTLKKVSRANPWHTEAMTVITGSKEEANKPLTEILEQHFNLQMDHFIDKSGFTRAGHALDTQGYIAHNDEMIVLAYRCTTSGFDWLTNLTTTSSAWEPMEDIAQGHSGYISAVSGLCCTPYDEVKPRVHTGFYNNFLVTAPFIQKHIDPLLAPDRPPRKLFVVGHSLGAGIASMAACYFLLQHDFSKLPHKLVVVTAGSPNSCKESMAIRIKQEMERLRPLDKAVICRIVRDKDIVPTVPPAIFGFRHLEKLVFITRDGDIIINPRLNSKVDMNAVATVLASDPHLDVDDEDDDDKLKEKAASVAKFVD